MAAPVGAAMPRRYGCLMASGVGVWLRLGHGDGGTRSAVDCRAVSLALRQGLGLGACMRGCCALMKGGARGARTVFARQCTGKYPRLRIPAFEKIGRGVWGLGP